MSLFQLSGRACCISQALNRGKYSPLLRNQLSETRIKPAIPVAIVTYTYIRIVNRRSLRRRRNVAASSSNDIHGYFSHEWMWRQVNGVRLFQRAYAPHNEVLSSVACMRIYATLRKNTGTCLFLTECNLERPKATLFFITAAVEYCARMKFIFKSYYATKRYL